MGLNVVLVILFKGFSELVFGVFDFCLLPVGLGFAICFEF